MATKPVGVDWGLHAGWANQKRIKGKIKDANGYDFGLYTRINFSKKLYLHPAVDFTQRKSDNQGTTVRINQLQIPVRVGYSIVNTNIFGLRGFAGPEVDFRMKKVKNLGEDGAEVKKVTWGARLGVGVDLWKFSLDVDYKFGLGNCGSNVSHFSGFNLGVGIRIS